MVEKNSSALNLNILDKTSDIITINELDNNEKFSGCTIHYVNSKLDSGKIILQKKVRLNKNETPKTLAKKILAEEHRLYPKAILKIFSL